MPRIPANDVDHADAVEIATAAGQLLLEVRRELAGAEPKVIKDEGDRRSQEFIAAALSARHPDDAVLSEEAVDDPTRLDASRVWIIDPLDGTREFSEEGRSDWAVHVALVVDGALAAGAVALPALGLTLGTMPPPPLPPPGPARPRILGSRTRLTPQIEALAEQLGGDLVLMGSAGAKAMAVVRGEADVYAHSGGQYEWDSAAPVAVAAAAHLHVSRIDGSPLEYNRPNPYLPDLLICRPELVDRVMEALAQQ
ncbi:MAG: 3(2), 5-bisphosphate nucleotidase [Acidimicrobiaceae bacterium]|nr:3(2), 5-bisphosphate nucleotidase [Acidimicrobiaceae bacterium]